MSSTSDGDSSEKENTRKKKGKAQSQPKKKRAPAPLKNNATVIHNSSITTDGADIPTVVGPISGWACIPENLPNHPTMAFFGKRRTGKSTTITNILYHCCQHIPFGIVMSDTAYAGYWDQIVPARHIVQGLRQDVLEWLIERQKQAVKKYGIKDKRIAAFIVLDDVIADQKVIRWSADLARFFVQGRHLGITVFIASQYLKGVGPMVRGNCDYLFLQPIYNKTQRDTLWDLEAAFMDKNDFNTLMDDIIVRENLPGNCAQDPKKRVRIMVCCDFEDSSVPQEKFYHFTPVKMDELPPFRLCHPSYWDPALQKHDLFGGNGGVPKLTNLEKLHNAESLLKRLA